MSGIPYAALRELRGPLADELADEAGEARSEGADAREAGADEGADDGCADCAVVAAEAGGRSGPRKAIPRDMMSLHGRRIDDLCRWGWSYQQIGKRVGCNISALSRMRSNPAYEPHYGLGIALTKLWIEQARARLEMLRSKT